MHERLTRGTRGALVFRAEKSPLSLRQRAVAVCVCGVAALVAASAGKGVAAVLLLLVGGFAYAVGRSYTCEVRTEGVGMSGAQEWWVGFDEIQAAKLFQRDGGYVLSLRSTAEERTEERVVDSSWLGHDEWRGVVEALVRASDVGIIVDDPELAVLVPRERRLSALPTTF